MTDATPSRIHFAGMNTRDLAASLEGHDVLISYADIWERPGVWADAILPRLQAGKFGRTILDSGAYSENSRPGFSVDLDTYIALIHEHGHLFDVIVGLDDIGGDLARTWTNGAKLEAAGVDAMTVFHQGEDWGVLEHYVAQGRPIGVGFARIEGKLVGGGPAFLAEFFDRVDGRVDVHGFGMTQYADAFPFASVDSTTYIAELCALGKTLDLDGKRKEGTLGELRDVFEAMTRDELLALVLDSHPGRKDPAPEWIDDASRGQARTTLRRLWSTDRGRAALAALFPHHFDDAAQVVAQAPAEAPIEAPAALWFEVFAPTAGDCTISHSQRLSTTMSGDAAILRARSGRSRGSGVLAA